MSALNQGTGRRKSRSWLIVGSVAVLGASMLWLYGCATTSASAEPVQVFQGEPEVQWSPAPHGNQIYGEFEIEPRSAEDEYTGKISKITEFEPYFRIPDEYFLLSYISKKDGETIRNGKPITFLPKDQIGEIAVYATSFLPVNSDKKFCWKKEMIFSDYHNASKACLSGVFVFSVRYDLQSRFYKAEKTNRFNYLNYYKKAMTGTHQFLDKNTIYGLNGEYYDDSNVFFENNGGQGVYVKMINGNIDVGISCSHLSYDKKNLTDSDSLSSICTHEYLHENLNIVVRIKYEKKYLPYWQKIQSNTTTLIEQFAQAAR